MTYLNIVSERGTVFLPIIIIIIRCSGKFSTCFIANFILYLAVKKLKIDYHLAKLLIKTKCFFETRCILPNKLSTLNNDLILVALESIEQNWCGIHIVMIIFGRKLYL